MPIQTIRKEMKVNDIILHFPPKAQKIRRAIKNFAFFFHDLPQETLEEFLNRQGKTQTDIDPFIKKLNDILGEQDCLDAISITEKALAKVRELLHEEGKIGWGLKFTDQPAECGAGFEYILEPCFKPDSTDITFNPRGIEIYVPNASLKRLLGSMIDYEEGFLDDNFTGLLRLGFTISNPNVKSTCECGCSTGYGA